MLLESNLKTRKPTSPLNNGTSSRTFFPARRRRSFVISAMFLGFFNWSQKSDAAFCSVVDGSSTSGNCTKIYRRFPPSTAFCAITARPVVPDPAKKSIIMSPQALPYRSLSILLIKPMGFGTVEHHRTVKKIAKFLLGVLVCPNVLRRPHRRWTISPCLLSDRNRLMRGTPVPSDPNQMRLSAISCLNAFFGVTPTATRGRIEKSAVWSP